MQSCHWWQEITPAEVESVMAAIESDDGVQKLYALIHEKRSCIALWSGSIRSFHE